MGERKATFRTAVAPIKGIGKTTKLQTPGCHGTRRPWLGHEPESRTEQDNDRQNNIHRAAQSTGGRKAWCQRKSLLPPACAPKRRSSGQARDSWCSGDDRHPGVPPRIDSEMAVDPGERSAESSIARTLHRQNPFRFLERRVRQRTLLLCAQQPCRSLEKVSQRLSRDTVLGRGRNCVKRAPDRRRLLVFGIRLNMRAMRHRPGPGDGTISDIRCVSRCI